MFFIFKNILLNSKFKLTPMANWRGQSLLDFMPFGICSAVSDGIQKREHRLKTGFL
ncbi:hypothetical protein BMS3Bbin03_00031 [bacterium BMS3Bbin03]|nr:hypothetical protein BMS3Bbin03_00031 [bacterium BMS3Bbin03]